MKALVIAAVTMTLAAACSNNSGKTGSSGDTTTINTKTSTPADGGPNYGMGVDTNVNNQIHDSTAAHDSAANHR